MTELTGYINHKEMQKLTGKSKSTLWRMYAQRNEFPRPERTKGGTFLGWTVETYNAWKLSSKL